jgi:tetrahydromethanopterin S-methyltransferase subunit F
MLEDQKIKEGIERYISHVRYMSSLTDGQLRLMLAKAAEERPEMFEAFIQANTKKDMAEIKKMVKDIKVDPKDIARKVA